jgi:hypothetical protein
MPESLISSVPQLKVFASFDCERDEKLFKRLLAEGTSPDAKFTVFDRSTRGVLSQEAMNGLCDRISQVDVVLVLCGQWTHRSANVNAEVEVAKELGKRYYLLKGRRLFDCGRPSSARIDDKMYKWTPGVVNQLVIRNI